MAKYRPEGPPPTTAIFTLRKIEGRSCHPGLPPLSLHRSAAQVLIEVDVEIQVLDHPYLPAGPECCSALPDVVEAIRPGHPVRCVGRREAAGELPPHVGGRIHAG